MAGDLRCPDCDHPLDGDLGRVPAAVDEDTLRLALSCTVCTTTLELEAPVDEIQVDVVGQTTNP